MKDQIYMYGELESWVLKDTPTKYKRLQGLCGPGLSTLYNYEQVSNKKQWKLLDKIKL